jgi:hypothetical protein
MGEAWDDDELLQLLQSIQKKKARREIADEHKRTLGAIGAQLKKMAAEYHYTYNYSVVKIQSLTGLSEKEVQSAILRRAPKPAVATTPPKEPEATPSTVTKGQMADAVALETLDTVKQIRDMMATLLERLGPQNPASPQAPASAPAPAPTPAPASTIIKGFLLPPAEQRHHTLQFEGQLDPDGNPIVAAVLLNPAGEIAVEFGRRLEKGKDAIETEVHALWCGVSVARDLKIRQLLVECKSQALVEQLTSRWQTNDRRVAEPIARIRSCAQQSLSFLAVRHVTDFTAEGPVAAVIQELLAGEDYLFRVA